MLKVANFQIKTVSLINLIDDLQCAIENAMTEAGIDSEGFCEVSGQSFVDSENQNELARFVSIVNCKVTLEVADGNVVFDLI